MKRMINMTKKYDKDDKTDDKYDKNNDKGARKIIKMIKKKHDKDDNNDGMGWVVFGGVGGVVGRGQIQFLVGWRWWRKKGGGVVGREVGGAWGR